jgi:hypothetical protein
MDELTKEQIMRQEFVDNSILELLNNLVQNSNIEYEPRMIFEIREVIKEWVVEKLDICNEMSFYPYIENE